MSFWQNSPGMPLLHGESLTLRWPQDFYVLRVLSIRFDVLMAGGSPWLSIIQGSICCQDHFDLFVPKTLFHILFTFEIFKRFGSLFIWGKGWTQMWILQRLALWFHFCWFSIYSGIYISVKIPYVTGPIGLKIKKCQIFIGPI